MSDVALEIPRRLNDSPRMFWWEIDVSLLFLAAVLAGMITGFFVTGCAAGVLLAWAHGMTNEASATTTGNRRSSVWAFAGAGPTTRAIPMRRWRSWQVCRRPVSEAN